MFVVVCGVAIAAGVAGFVTIGYWYAVDTGMLGNDIMLVVSQTPIVLGLVVSAVCVLAGVSMILVRRDVSAASVGGVMLLLTAVALSIAVVVGVRAYPQVEQAERFSRPYRNQGAKQSPFGRRLLRASPSQ